MYQKPWFFQVKFSKSLIFENLDSPMAPQEALGARSVRFRLRTDAMSGPEQPGNDLGEFHFALKNQVLGHILAGPAWTRLGRRSPLKAISPTEVTDKGKPPWTWPPGATTETKIIILDAFPSATTLLEPFGALVGAPFASYLPLWEKAVFFLQEL